MGNTVLITGASTGIGKAAAQLFQEKGWNVAATMRTPEKATDLAQLDNVLCTKLDVTDPDSVKQAIEKTLERFTSIDVLVNNAGYALMGPFEAMSREQVQRQINTNVLGLMEVTRAILPHFRQQGKGTLINVASVGGRTAFPLYSAYQATKWAVEGFSEALQFELRPLNIQVKIIEPGFIKTDFYTRSMDIARDPDIPVYDQFVDRAVPKMTDMAQTMGVPPEAPARFIYKAATDGSWKLRYPAAGNARLSLFFRKLAPDWLFNGVLRFIITR